MRAQAGEVYTVYNYDRAIEIAPVPAVEELNARVWGEEFRACVIEKEELEAIWRSHNYDGALK